MSDKEVKTSAQEQPTKKKTMNRRTFLGLATAGAAGIVLGDVAGLAQAKLMPKSTTVTSSPDADTGFEPFYGTHQSGIITPSQKFVNLAAFDITTSKVEDVKELMRTWTRMMASMMEGQAPDIGEGAPGFLPEDTAEALGLQSAKLTLTVGVGRSLFEKDGTDRFGLRSRMPKGLTAMPIFHGDAIQDAASHGDLIVQACANDPMLCFPRHSQSGEVGARRGPLEMAAGWSVGHEARRHAA